MAYQRYLKIPTVIDLKATTKSKAIDELARTLLKKMKVKKQKPVIDAILENEAAGSTFIGQGLAIPHAIFNNLKANFAIAVGRSQTGIKYDAARGASAYIIVLVLSKDGNNNNLVELRSEISTFFKSAVIKDRIMDDGTINLKNTDISIPEKSKSTVSKTSAGKKGDPVIASALTLLRDLKANAIVFIADAASDNEFLKHIKTKKSVIVITSNKSRFDDSDKHITELIQAPPFPSSRTGQIKIGLLLAISRNLLKRTDRIVCVSGNSKLGKFDTIVTIDIEKEYEFFLSDSRSILPPDVKPEVLEKVMGLANEIAIEGREGKPTGTIFVLGDTNSVNANVRQLIINPFRGYSEAERNILDPGLDETIKEFAGIDGAFIITGDGVIISAGTYLRPPSETDSVSDELPSGFGARHAAAAGMTACTNSLAITISESTGMVSLFKNGTVMVTLAKPVAKHSSRGGTRLMSVSDAIY